MLRPSRYGAIMTSARWRLASALMLVGPSSGRKMRLKGRGLPSKQAGDFYVVLQIALPDADTEAAKAAYREFQAAFDFNPRTRLGV